MLQQRLHPIVPRNRNVCDVNLANFYNPRIDDDYVGISQFRLYVYLCTRTKEELSGAEKNFTISLFDYCNRQTELRHLMSSVVHIVCRARKTILCFVCRSLASSIGPLLSVPVLYNDCTIEHESAYVASLLHGPT